MKKFLSALLAVLLLFTFTVSLAEDEDDTSTIEFESRLLNALDRHSVSEWFGTSSNRALLTVLILADMPDDAGLDVSEFLLGGSYVGKADDNLFIMVMGYSGDTLYTLYYCPALESARYSTLDVSELNEAGRRLFLESAGEAAGYDMEKNDLGDVMEVMQTLAEILSD